MTVIEIDSAVFAAARCCCCLFARRDLAAAIFSDNANCHVTPNYGCGPSLENAENMPGSILKPRGGLRVKMEAVDLSLLMDQLHSLNQLGLDKSAQLLVNGRIHFCLILSFSSHF